MDVLRLFAVLVKVGCLLSINGLFLAYPLVHNTMINGLCNKHSQGSLYNSGLENLNVILSCSELMYLENSSSFAVTNWQKE